MKLLITGANGFIGSYFINKYQNKYNIKKFSFLKDDISTLDFNGVDVVLHLSALVHQMAGASFEEYEKVNVTQTMNLANKAKESGVKQFIFMSTVKVYGEESDKKYTENSKCNPEDAYGISKLKAECELLKLETENFQISIVRTPIVYGYGVKANIKNLINLVSKMSILPFGGIENKRSMVYIGNLCHLIDLLIKKSISGVFLISDDETISTSCLLNKISLVLNKKIFLVKIPYFDNFLKLIQPKIYKKLYKSLEIDWQETKKKLDVKNPYSITEGLNEMFNNPNGKIKY